VAFLCSAFVSLLLLKRRMKSRRAVHNRPVFPCSCRAMARHFLRQRVRLVALPLQLVGVVEELCNRASLLSDTASQVPALFHYALLLPLQDSIDPTADVLNTSFAPMFQQRLQES